MVIQTCEKGNSSAKEWKVCKLENLIRSTQLGGNYPNTEEETPYPLVKMGNIERGTISLSKIEYIEKGSLPSQKDRLVFGDLLFNTRNTPELVGKVAIWKNELPLAFFNSNLMRLKFTSEINDFFMNYLFNSHELLTKLKSIATGTTSVGAIYTRDLLGIEVAVPQLTEQIAIGNVLLNLDDLIQSLDGLIEKKKYIKQGSMQELLNCKKRLPRFKDKWAKKPFKCLCEFINGRAYSQNELLHDGKYKVLRLGNLFTNEKWYFSDLVLPEKMYCEKNDLLYAWSASFGPTIWQGDKVIFHYHIWKVKCLTEIDKDFLYHYLRLDTQRIMNEFQGGTMSHLTKEAIENRTCYHPESKEEQNAIAQVLTDMDLEIVALERKRDKYRLLKVGLMQQLLTGRIRLKCQS